MPLVTDLSTLDHVDMVIVRGLPGSGKTEMAKSVAELGYTHLEPNMFFMKDGQYHYDATRVAEARQWCIGRVREELDAGRRVVVSGVFAKPGDAEIYSSLATSHVIIEMTKRVNRGGFIPKETIDDMARRWESIPGAICY